MTTWPDLLAAALIGTDRRPLPGTDDSASSLLDQAAAWSVYRRAGIATPPHVPQPQPAPPELSPVVSAAAASRFAYLLDPSSPHDSATRAALVTEWLTVAIDRGLRVPPEFLPELLESARRDSALRPLVTAVGGARASWLAGQNPEWTYLTATSDESAAHDPAGWHEGTRGQRSGYLTVLRRADPDAARQLLTVDWSTLAPEERAQLVEVLRVQLGPADEDFLESALADRRKEVRVVAADLLGALPGSAYNDRFLSRARACLVVDGGEVVVTPPSACDASMRRDGIIAKAPAGTGERAWWLRQILARTPLAAFISDSPAAFLRLRVADDWARTTHEGLADAAVAQHDHRWAAALLDVVESRAKSVPADRPLVEALYAVLDPDEVARRVMAAFAGTAVGRSATLLESLLRRCPAPWPDPLSTIALRGLDSAARGDERWFNYADVTRLAAIRMSISCAAEATHIADRFGVDHPDDNKVYLLDRLAATLRLRHEMIQELA